MWLRLMMKSLQCKHQPQKLELQEKHQPVLQPTHIFQIIGKFIGFSAPHRAELCEVSIFIKQN